MDWDLVLELRSGPAVDAWSWRRGQVLGCSRPRGLVLVPTAGILSWHRGLDLVLESRPGPGAGDWLVVLELFHPLVSFFLL